MEKDKIGERIKFIRKELGLTQEEFGIKIGVKGNTVTGYEKGIRRPSDAVISMICLIFQIDQTWLRTGEGDNAFITKSPVSSSLQDLYSHFDCNALERSFLDSYFALKKHERYAFCAMLKEMFPSLSEIIDSDPISLNSSGENGIEGLLQKPLPKMTDAEVQTLKDELNREIDKEKEAEEKSLASSVSTGKGNEKRGVG